MEIVIIGSGPAGIASAIYLKRAGLNVTIVSTGVSALDKAEKIENYYGIQSISGKDLAIQGITQAKALGVNFLNEEVVGFEMQKTLIVKTSKSKIPASHLIIATGIGRKVANIEGLKKLEGKGISYCATCDGYFFKNKDVAVLGSGDYALSEASELAKLAKSVTIFTNGNTMPPQTKHPVITDKLKSFNGNDVLQSITLENGKILELQACFIAIGTAGSTNIANMLGLVTDGSHIKVNLHGQTNVHGVYAVGDCTGMPYQIGKAIFDGMIAAKHIIDQSKK